MTRKQDEQRGVAMATFQQLFALHHCTRLKAHSLVRANQTGWPSATAAKMLRCRLGMMMMDVSIKFQSVGAAAAPLNSAPLGTRENFSYMTMRKALEGHV